MQFAHRDQPENLFPQDLDEYWSHGWFRMRQNVFTTHFLEFGGRFHSAVWLRVGLSKGVTDKKFAELKKLNRRFRVEIQSSDATGTTAAHEVLFRRYRDTLAFEVSPTLRSLLFGRKAATIFQTREVNLYDGEVLIAAGIFDIGKRAAAGITCFYDPAYKKHSLGKYLIYLKMEYCASLGLDYFYPGYFAPGHARFDYKLHLGAASLEYLDLADGAWRVLEPGVSRPDPLAAMESKLQELQTRLQERSLAVRCFRYQHLDINLNPQLQGMPLFDFPLFLSAGAPTGPQGELVIVFDPRDGLYHVLQCRSVYHFDIAEVRPAVFDSDLLIIERVLFSTAELEDLAICWMGVQMLVRG